MNVVLEVNIVLDLLPHLTHCSDLVGWSEGQRTPTMAMNLARNCLS